MSYKFVESVVLSPRNVRLDVSFMRELLHHWEHPAQEPAAAAPAAAPSPPAASPAPTDPAASR